MEGSVGSSERLQSYAGDSKMGIQNEVIRYLRLFSQNRSEARKETDSKRAGRR